MAHNRITPRQAWHIIQQPDVTVWLVAKADAEPPTVGDVDPEEIEEETITEIMIVDNTIEGGPIDLPDL